MRSTYKQFPSNPSRNLPVGELLVSELVDHMRPTWKHNIALHARARRVQAKARICPSLSCLAGCFVADVGCLKAE